MRQLYAPIHPFFTQEGEEDDSAKLKFDWQRQDKAPPRERYSLLLITNIIN